MYEDMPVETRYLLPVAIFPDHARGAALLVVWKDIDAKYSFGLGCAARFFGVMGVPFLETNGIHACSHETRSAYDQPT